MRWVASVAIALGSRQRRIALVRRYSIRNLSGREESRPDVATKKFRICAIFPIVTADFYRAIRESDPRLGESGYTRDHQQSERLPDETDVILYSSIWVIHHVII